MKDLESHLIEGNVAPEIIDVVRSGCTAHWEADFRESEAGRLASDFVAFRRHDDTVRHIVPWLSRHFDLATTHIVDFGAGCGSSSLAFAHFASAVHGFEICAPSGAAFLNRMKVFGADNTQLTRVSPEEIGNAALRAIQANTVVVLVAVIEHLREHEQVEYLKSFWGQLHPGQAVVIVESPNFYSYFDSHTFEAPFANYVPDALFVDWLRRHGQELRFRDSLLQTAATEGTEAALISRRRLGVGVTPEPFLQAFSTDLNELVIGDGFDDEMLRWFDISFDDQLLLSAWERYGVDLPVGFAKNVQSFIFRKPRTVSEAAMVKQRNDARRKSIIETHSLTSALRATQRSNEELGATLMALEQPQSDNDELFSSSSPDDEGS